MGTWEAPENSGYGWKIPRRAPTWCPSRGECPETQVPFLVRRVLQHVPAGRNPPSKGSSLVFRLSEVAGNPARPEALLHLAGVVAAPRPAQDGASSGGSSAQAHSFSDAGCQRISADRRVVVGEGLSGSADPLPRPNAQVPEHHIVGRRGEYLTGIPQGYDTFLLRWKRAGGLLSYRSAAVLRYSPSLRSPAKPPPTPFQEPCRPSPPFLLDVPQRGIFQP